MFECVRDTMIPILLPCPSPSLDQVTAAVKNDPAAFQWASKEWHGDRHVMAMVAGFVFPLPLGSLLLLSQPLKELRADRDLWLQVFARVVGPKGCV